ncbi:MAG: PorV/PorQ family protein [Candidatus Marinimicrobia bacterium]|nr:PorV/PorQ family protein [Candidatus Neomarinimicrobiota bacterium]MCF7850343.1 PorV/PorQ family protein [Candidatus Neomarinimicrobiota bacterium]MCF7904948.1 PorV/PorQ family protein [Candidatus Neomarinimicrobiota bacterium]
MKNRSIIILLLILVQSAFGQGNLFPELGGQRAGTSSFPFLKIPIHARAHGMAGAYTAIANDASSLFWNPAGAAQIDEQFNVMVDQSNWIADFTLSSFAGIWRFGDIHHIGVHALALYAPPMEITTEYQPDGTGEYFNYGDVLLGLTYALRMTDRFSFGIGTKIVEEQLAELQMRAYLLDLGTYYRTGYKDLRFAVSLLNFGSPAGPKGEYLDQDSMETHYDSFSPPTIFRLAIAHEWLQSERQQLTTSLQLNHPVDNAENISFGLEYGFSQLIYIRAGKTFGDDTSPWSAGIGIRGAGFTFDYSYSDMRDLNRSEHFSFGWSF